MLSEVYLRKRKIRQIAEHIRSQITHEIGRASPGKLIALQQSLRSWAILRLTEGKSRDPAHSYIPSAAAIIRETQTHPLVQYVRQEMERRGRDPRGEPTESQILAFHRSVVSDEYRRGRK